MHLTKPKVWKSHIKKYHISCVKYYKGKKTMILFILMLSGVPTLFLQIKVIHYSFNGLQAYMLSSVLV